MGKKRKIFPVEINQTESLLEFKAKIKNLNPQYCPCRLSKFYLQHEGFTWVSRLCENFDFSVMAFFGTSE